MALVMASTSGSSSGRQKKILGIVEASDEAKAKQPPRMMASRTNLLLSLPMLYCMVSANLG